MRILVFDDNATHRAAAQAQLKDHDLTVVGTYKDAQELLTPQVDHDQARSILEKEFPGFKPYQSTDEAKKAEYFAAQKIAYEQATTRPNFDVVLSDLLVPASGLSAYSGELVGKEMPVGIFIGLLAAVKARAKYVAIFTDSDHHSHPASTCIDVFNEGEADPTAFTVEDSKVLLSNTRNWIHTYDPNDLSKALEYPDYLKRTDTVRAKNWAELLAYLTA